MSQVHPENAVVSTGSNFRSSGDPCKKCKLATAILSFLTGGGIFILGIVVIAALPAANWARNSATGIWAGGIISFTGMMGIASACKPHLKVINAFYIFLGVCTAILSFLSIIIFIIATIYYAITLDCGVQKILKSDNCDKKNMAVGLHVTMMLFAGFEFLVSITGASLACGCCGCCGQKKDAGQTVVVLQQGDVNKTV